MTTRTRLVSASMRFLATASPAVLLMTASVATAVLPIVASAVPAFLLIMASAVPADAATLSGRVRLEGPRPTPPVITMSADPACDRQFPNGRPAEMIVAAADGGLANVIVYVRSGFPKKFAFPALHQPYETVIDQKGCAFVPRVVAVRVGEELTIRNSDATIHTVSGRSIENRPFNEATPGQGFELRRTFERPELPVKLKCDVHPWMAAYIGVFDHPYFAVTGPDGSFTIQGLPESKYTVEAWHESLGVQSATVELDEGSPASLDFSFAGN